MNAVEILTSARDRFARNRRNWVSGILAATRSDAEEGQCFCSIGGVLKAGGGMTVKHGTPRTITSVLADANPFGIDDPKYQGLVRLGYAFTASTKPEFAAGLKGIEAVKEDLRKRGFHARPTLTALTYLQAAAKQVANKDVISYNDRDETEQTWKEVLHMFDVAIANAKRRHINGKRYAKKAAA